jgi:hypothetical protein
MRPTTTELLSAVVESLERQVAPHVQDKWAASALRSAAQLLRHAAIRSEHERRMQSEDNRDARETLESSLAHLATRGELAEVRAIIEPVLRLPDPGPYDAAALDARNEGYQSVIERLLEDGALRSAEPAVHGLLRSYLRRRLQREHALYFPVFTGPPF